jgi:hypothetical protein
MLTIEDTTRSALPRTSSWFTASVACRWYATRVIGILSSGSLRYFIKTGENLESFFAKLRRGGFCRVVRLCGVRATPRNGRLVRIGLAVEGNAAMEMRRTAATA